MRKNSLVVSIILIFTIISSVFCLQANAATTNTATSNFTIQSGQSAVYSFPNTLNNYVVFFGKDAQLTLSAAQKGTKDLAYNVDPVDNISKKYNITVGNNYEFINFTGNPKFDSTATVKFYIPVTGDNPVLYRLKSGSTTGELEQLSDVKLDASGSEPILQFTTNQLAKTYVIASNKIDSITATASASTGNDNSGSSSYITATSSGDTLDNSGDALGGEDTASNSTDNVDSPKTGSNESTYEVLLEVCLIMLVSLFLIKNKSRKN